MKEHSKFKYELLDTLKEILNSFDSVEHDKYKQLLDCHSKVVNDKVYVCYNKNKNKSYYKGFASCKNKFYCPVCMTNYMKDNKRIDIKKEIKWWKDKDVNNDVYMLTLDIQHTKEDSLYNLVKSLKDAVKKLFKSSHMKNAFGINKKAPYRISVTEVKYSFENGWNPHIHILFFSNKLVNRKKNRNDFSSKKSKTQIRYLNYNIPVINKLRNAWKKICKNANIPIGGNSFKVTYADKIDDYLTKGMDLDYLTNDEKYNIETPPKNSYTPMELLCIYHNSTKKDRRCIKHFKDILFEFVTSIKYRVLDDLSQSHPHTLKQRKESKKYDAEVEIFGDIYAVYEMHPQNAYKMNTKDKKELQKDIIKNNGKLSEQMELNYKLKKINKPLPTEERKKELLNKKIEKLIIKKREAPNVYDNKNIIINKPLKKTKFEKDEGLMDL